MPENQSSPATNRTGVISIIKVLQHFGVKDLEKIYNDNPLTDDKATWEKLQKIAKRYSIKAR